MPIYEYRCRKCNETFEHLARTLSDAASRCPSCGAAGPVKQFSTFSTSQATGRTPCASGACPEPAACAGGACAGGTCPLQ